MVSERDIVQFQFFDEKIFFSIEDGTSSSTPVLSSVHDI